MKRPFTIVELSAAIAILALAGLIVTASVCWLHQELAR
jgi:hypothetical protein